MYKIENKKGTLKARERQKIRTASLNTNLLILIKKECIFLSFLLVVLLSLRLEHYKQGCAAVVSSFVQYVQKNVQGANEEQYKV